MFADLFITRGKIITHQEKHAVSDAFVHAWVIWHPTSLATLQAEGSTSQCVVYLLRVTLLDESDVSAILSNWDQREGEKVLGQGKLQCRGTWQRAWISCSSVRESSAAGCGGVGELAKTRHYLIFKWSSTVCAASIACHDLTNNCKISNFAAP